MRVSACANTGLSKHFEISIAMIFECPWIVVLIARRKVKSLLTNVDKLNLSYWNIVGFIYIYIYILGRFWVILYVRSWLFYKDFIAYIAHFAKICCIFLLRDFLFIPSLCTCNFCNAIVNLWVCNYCIRMATGMIHQFQVQLFYKINRFYMKFLFYL